MVVQAVYRIHMHTREDPGSGDPDDPDTGFLRDYDKRVLRVDSHKSRENEALQLPVGCFQDDITHWTLRSNSGETKCHSFALVPSPCRLA